MIRRAVRHIRKTAEVPSFSTFEERLHPYIRSVFGPLEHAEELEVPGNNLVFRIGGEPELPRVALAAHLDKINHYGEDFPERLPVEVGDDHIEGAMDDCAGLGMMLALAERADTENWPELLFFFSEMEESKGLKEHPQLLKNGGEGYTHGMGARRIAGFCLEKEIIPAEVITLDTTPVFKGDPGLALYSRHWELNDLDPRPELIEATERSVARFITIDSRIRLDNNTNDYLHYGEVLNKEREEPVVSVALEPSIYPYHQLGERVFIEDIERALHILAEYLRNYPK